MITSYLGNRFCQRNSPKRPKNQMASFHTCRPSVTIDQAQEAWPVGSHATNAPTSFWTERAAPKTTLGSFWALFCSADFSLAESAVSWRIVCKDPSLITNVFVNRNCSLGSSWEYASSHRFSVDNWCDYIFATVLSSASPCGGSLDPLAFVALIGPRRGKLMMKRRRI